MRLIREIAVALDRDVGRAVELRHAAVDELVAALGALPRRDDDARVGHREARNRHDLLEGVVVNEPRTLLRHLRAARGLEARERKRVRPDVEPALEVAGMHHRRKKFVTPVAEPVQNAETDVVHPRLHAAVKARDAPVVVALRRPRRMHLLVQLAVVRLLKDLEGADADGPKHLEIRDRQRRGVHVHTANPHLAT